MEAEPDNSIEAATDNASAVVIQDGISQAASAGTEMVPMGEGSREEVVKFIIQDETNSNWKSSKCSQSLSLSTAVADLYTAVAKESGYVAGTFYLFWRRQDPLSGEEEEELSQENTATLFELKMPTEPAKVFLLIKERNDSPPERDKSYGDTNDSNSTGGEVSTRVTGAAISSGTGTSSSQWTSFSNPTYNSSYNSYSTSGYGYSYGKSDTGFVGLVNQAMTCYLNSLLQTLYMTPEFRNAIYRWRFVPSKEGDEAYRQESVKCIPHQLQRLFLHLQCSDKRSVETTDITTSFGWDGSDAWQQHDVQELCRVMFDALEKRFKKDLQGVTQGNLINELYQGKWRDYVECKKCGHESSREDTFLDIPLVIKPFGLSVTYQSVEEALEAFVESETLEGDNQYFCEKCNEKQDAQKGLKFQQFPYLLTLQLKRFDFDYSTMHRIKLNDKMTFPKVLDLNPFVNEKGDKPCAVPNVMRYEDYVVDRFDQCSNQSTYPSELPSYAEATSVPKPDTDVSSSQENGDLNEEEVDTSSDEVKKKRHPDGIAEMLSQGPYVYELFSIMIHSGSAIGGHYYAYIKSFSDKRWYCFNDQSVSRISQEEIEQTFGGTEKESKGYYSSMYTHSANAYMLMYRRVSLDDNQEFVDENNFPAHLKKEMELEKQKVAEKKKRQEMEKKLCKFKLFGDNFEKPGEILERKIEIHEDSSFAEAIKEAHKLLGYTGRVPLERCRLVKYDDYSETLDQSLDIDEFGDQTFGQVVGGARNYYSFELYLETRKEHETFQKYNKGGMKIKLLLVDLNTGEVTPNLPMRAEHGWTVGEFKGNIGKLLDLDPAHMVLVLEMYNDGRLMSNDTATLRSEGLYRKHAVFVSSDPYDCQKPYNDSLMCKHVEGYVNSIMLNITLPPRQNKLNDCAVCADKRPEIPDLVPSGESPPQDQQQDNLRNDGAEAESNSTKDDDEGFSKQATDDGNKVGGDDKTPPTQKVGEEDVDEGLGDEGESPEPLPNTEGNTGGEEGKEDTEEKEKGRGDEEEAVAGKKRDIQLRVDRRTTLSELKKKLEVYVGVESMFFKMYRVYNNQQEYEIERPSDTLMSTPSDSKIVVRLGRALLPGEHRVKLFLLRVNESEFFKLMMEAIVAKNTPIGEFKKQIEVEAKQQGVECELKANRMRLRKKMWRTPGTVYPDNLLIDKDVYIYAGSEMFVEPLECEEPMKSGTQMQLYIRRWRPSQYVLDPYQEVVLDTANPEELKRKISACSSIPVDKVSIAKGVGSFPADMSVLDVESDLDWDPAIKSINSSPFSFYDDGGVVYYKDSAEVLMELSTERKNDLRKSEVSRLNKNSVQGTGSTSYNNYSYYRKEKALKIYTEEDKKESED